MPNEISAFSENTKLIENYQKNKEIEIRNKIVENNLPLVFSIAHKYSRNGGVCCEFDDLVNEGVIGLITAIENFDVKRKTVFSTYATYWIFKGISLNFRMGTLQMPGHRMTLYKKFSELGDSIRESGQDKSFEQMAKELKVSNRILADTINQKETVSIDGMVSRNRSFLNGSSEDRISFLSSHEDEEQKIFNRLDFQKIELIMEKKLSERELFIIMSRFGLGPYDSMTLEQIASKLGTSYEYVRIVQNKAIKKLRRWIK